MWITYSVSDALDVDLALPDLFTQFPQQCRYVYAFRASGFQLQRWGCWTNNLANLLAERG